MSRIQSTLSAAVLMALSTASMVGRTMRTILPNMKLSPYSGEITLAPMTYGYKGKGISMARQKRASTKARNRARNKAHH